MYDNCKTETEKKLLITLNNIKGGLEAVRFLSSEKTIPFINVLIKEVEKTLEECKDC